MTDFSQTRELFHLPEGVIYLDGNSLGPLPKAAQAALNRAATQEWGELLIRGWNQAGWYQAPLALGDKIAPLIGAEPGHVLVGDTLSLRLYQAVASALEFQVKAKPEAKIILSDSGNFPSDLYMIKSLIGQLDRGYELHLVEPQQVADALDELAEQVAVLCLTQVDYRTSRRHDLAALTQQARQVGALSVWDLAHSAGAIAVDLAGAGADFAVGCTYKFLNGGPGAPAFIYVRPGLVDQVSQPLSGWLGHAAPFAFDTQFQAAPGIAKFRVGTPPVLQMAALDTALNTFVGVDMALVEAAVAQLTQAFIAQMSAATDQLELISPTDPARRGSQLSFRPRQRSGIDAYAVIQALIAQGIIGDFRAPDLLRFGFSPLYLGLDEVTQAADTLGQILADRAWDRPEFLAKKAVT